MTGEVVRVVTSPSGRYRGEVIERGAGGFKVEVSRWTEEWVEGHGLIAACWTPVGRGATFADDIERAEELARIALLTWEPESA